MSFTQTLGRTSRLCEAGQTVDDQTLLQTRRDLNRTGVDFLITDVQVAHTLLDAAENTAVPGSRTRRIEEARRAYETITHLLAKLTPSPEQRAELENELASLRQRFSALG